MKIATTEQLREMDRRTIEEFHVPALVLTENAALRVVEFLSDRFGPLQGRAISVVCGKGNNGGDGLAIARHLSSRLHARVTVWLSAAPAEYRGEAAVDLQRAKAYGLELLPANKIDLTQAELIIDALFGTGIQGAVIGAAATIIEEMNKIGKPIIAVDIPSGLNADTATAAGAVVRATATVTFSLPKFGLLEYPGSSYVGELIVADICTPRALTEAATLNANWTQARDVSRWLPARRNGRDINKGTFGHVVVFAGSTDFAGAPVLVAEAAARAGAGLISLAVPKSLQAPISAHVSPVVMTHGIGEPNAGTFAAMDIETALSLAKKATAVALGPGLGRSKGVAAFIREFIVRCPVSLLVDADALTLLAQEPNQGASLIKGRTAVTVLTPHPGEMGRLLGIETRAVQESRRSAVTQASKKFGCVVLLKGARTLVAAPEGTLYLNSSGNPGMASGGSGDVLSGLIAALLAQKLKPIEAATAGAFIHGVAGDLAAASQGGAAGLVATDLISHFPKAIACCEGFERIAHKPGSNLSMEQPRPNAA